MTPFLWNIARKHKFYEKEVVHTSLLTYAVQMPMTLTQTYTFLDLGFISHPTLNELFEISEKCTKLYEKLGLILKNNTFKIIVEDSSWKEIEIRKTLK